MDISKLLARRSDLGTFLIHLTRDANDISAGDRLRAILASGSIEARSAQGAARNYVTDSQKCVCFTETPLEHTHLLVEKIDGRAIQFEPYGIAIPKLLGRKFGVNPVWYVDITPGHEWLMKPINAMVVEQVEAGTFEGSHICKIAPFIEQMGTGSGDRPYQKEFWWEREWRHVGDFTLPHRVIVLAPESEHEDLKAVKASRGLAAKKVFVDTDWGLERIISRLAGFDALDTDVP